VKSYPLGPVMLGVAILCAVPAIVQFYQARPADCMTARADCFVIRADYIPYPYSPAAYLSQRRVYKPTFYFGRMHVEFMFLGRRQSIFGEQDSLPFIWFLSFYPINVGETIKRANSVVAYNPNNPREARLVNLIVPFTNLMLLDAVVLFFVVLVPFTLHAMSYESGGDAQRSAQTSVDDASERASIGETEKEMD